MLDEKDLQALQAMMEMVVDVRAEKTEKLIDSKIESRAIQAENLILNEMDRTRSITESKIAAVQKNMDELSQYCRITKLESDNISLLLPMITRLEKEFEEFKQRTA